MPEFFLRFATPDDASGIFRLVSELANYEKLEHELISSPDDFRRALQDPKSKVEVLLAFWSGEMVAFALFFENFSTFLGKPGLYLEDLFVQPEFRARGVGTALMTRLIEIATERKYGRVEWTVLDWNETAIQFYTEKIGAQIMSSWRICRLVME
jgi:GNAT superfamily N-acetyltransferase